MTSDLKLSLVVATLGRRDEIARLIDSIARQTRPPDELIFVDQNDDLSIAPLLGRCPTEIVLRHIHRPDIRGLSRARNIGWKASDADLFLFPDDDCWYPPDLIERMLSTQESTKADIVSGRAADLEGTSINGRFNVGAGWVDRSNVWSTQIEWVVLVRRKVLDDIGGYDPHIGVGNANGACEGQDLTLRALDAGFTQYYNPGLFGHHAQLDTVNPDAAMRAKGKTYGRGMGFVLRKHEYPAHVGLNWAARPMARVLFSSAQLNFARAAYFLNVARGRFSGYFLS